MSLDKDIKKILYLLVFVYFLFEILYVPLDFKCHCMNKYNPVFIVVLIFTLLSILVACHKNNDDSDDTASRVPTQLPLIQYGIKTVTRVIEGQDSLICSYDRMQRITGVLVFTQAVALSPLVLETGYAVNYEEAHFGDIYQLSFDEAGNPDTTMLIQVGYDAKHRPLSENWLHYNGGQTTPSAMMSFSYTGNVLYAVYDGDFEYFIYFNDIGLLTAIKDESGKDTLIWNGSRCLQSREGNYWGNGSWPSYDGRSSVERMIPIPLPWTCLSMQVSGVASLQNPLIEIDSSSGVAEEYTYAYAYNPQGLPVKADKYLYGTKVETRRYYYTYW